MRKINKQAPIQTFIDLSLDYRNSKWSDFVINHHEVYEETRSTILINEQCCLCGYTELPINNERKRHIDHYRKISLFYELTFDWNNFVVATKDSVLGAGAKDKLINQSNYQQIYQQIFNPVEDNVQDYFEYTIWGEIKSKNGISDNNKTKADKTIEVFNLNHNSLKQRRKNIISQIRSCSNVSCYVKLDIFKNVGFISLIEQYC